MTLAPRARVTSTIELVRPLGRGGMGQVWVGHHAALDIDVAVKFVSPDLLKRDPSFGERFVREARAAARIRDPHVVQILDQGLTAEGTPFIAMELLEGITLAALISRSGALTLAASSAIVSQVAGALAKAHRLGVVHRDIKPDNLFLTTTGSNVFVKILDFGIAKMDVSGGGNAVTSTGAVFGTPPYMSPEQLLDSKGVDEQADLWALAVVAYEAITAALPFQGATPAGLALAMHKESFRPPSQVDADLPLTLDGWFARAFARDANSRFKNANDLTATFTDACAGRASWGVMSAEASDSAEDSDGADGLPTIPRVAPPAHAPVANPIPTMAGSSSTLPPRWHRRPSVTAPLGVVVVLAATAVGVWSVVRAPESITTMPVSLSAPGGAGTPVSLPPQSAVPPSIPPPKATETHAGESVTARPMPSTTARQLATSMPTQRADAGPPKLPASTPPPDCTDPFWIDSQGIRRVKKECR